MWIQKKIPKPLLVYLIALFSYITAGTFISQGCSPPASCMPQRTSMVVEIPGSLQAANPFTNCLGWQLTAGPIALFYNYSWRVKVFVFEENGSVYSTRSYNSAFDPTTTEDNSAIVDDMRLNIEVPSCGRYTTRIVVQRDLQNDCTPPVSGQQLYMTWRDDSPLMEGTSVIYLFGSSLSNSYITYRGLEPII